MSYSRANVHWRSRDSSQFSPGFGDILDMVIIRQSPLNGSRRDLGRDTDIRYTAIMTSTLDAAIAKLAALSPDEQDRIGRWLLHELADDEQWARKFETSQDLLSKLAAEVRADQTGGRATDVDPDGL